MPPLPDYPDRGPDPDGAHHPLRLRLSDQAAAGGGGSEEHEEQQHHAGPGGDASKCSITVMVEKIIEIFSWNLSLFIQSLSTTEGLIKL